MGVGGCPMFPRDNVFHAEIRRLPVAPHSAANIRSSAGLRLRPGFYSGLWENSRGGMPINIVDGSKLHPWTNVIGGQYAYLSDMTPHPIPANPKIEGYPGAAWDRHLLVVDSSTCISHEFFYFTKVPVVNRWRAETAVKIDLRSNAPRPGGTAVASGGSMLSTMVRYDEVMTGDIDHVLGVSLPKISNRGPVWPSFGSDGRSSDPDAPRMGSWLRLRSDADLRGLGPQAATIARALQDHGAVVGDTGAEAMVIGGENDERWNDGDIDGLTRFKMSDFEVVDPTPMMVDPKTYQIR